MCGALLANPLCHGANNLCLNAGARSLRAPARVLLLLLLAVLHKGVRTQRHDQGRESRRFPHEPSGRQALPRRGGGGARLGRVVACAGALRRKRRFSAPASCRGPVHRARQVAASTGHRAGRFLRLRADGGAAPRPDPHRGQPAVWQMWGARGALLQSHGAVGRPGLRHRLHPAARLSHCVHAESAQPRLALGARLCRAGDRRRRLRAAMPCQVLLSNLGAAVGPTEQGADPRRGAPRLDLPAGSSRLRRTSALSYAKRGRESRCHRGSRRRHLAQQLALDRGQLRPHRTRGAPPPICGARLLAAVGNVHDGARPPPAVRARAHLQREARKRR